MIKVHASLITGPAIMEIPGEKWKVTRGGTLHIMNFSGVVTYSIARGCWTAVVQVVPK